MTSHESIENAPHTFHNKITNEVVKKEYDENKYPRASYVDQISAEMIKYGSI